jgi:hypothetical protein
MSFVNKLISYIIKFVLFYNTLWFNSDTIYSMIDFITPILSQLTKESIKITWQQEFKDLIWW